MSERLNFLYSSIADTQSTIRSVDIRCGILFLIVCAPAPLADKILEAAVHISCAPHLLQLTSALAALAWSATILALFMSVGAIGNPADRVPGERPLGSYYGGDLFRLGWSDAFANRRRKALRNVREEVALLPSSKEEIERELVFEKIKLAYIREIKMERFRMASRLAIAWIILAIATAAMAQGVAWH